MTKVLNFLYNSKLVRYVFGSGLLLLLNLGLVYIFGYVAGLTYWISFALTQAVVIMSGFLYMNFIVFSKKDVKVKRAFSHIVVLCIGFMLNVALGSLFVYIFNVWDMLATLIALIVTSLTKFFLYSRFTYAAD